MFKLIIQDDEGKTTVVPLIRDEVSIGRKEGNTIRLTERNVSRKHARILRQSGEVVVEDLQSHNGIRINGHRIEGRSVVGESDRIQIGDYLLEVRRDAVAANMEPSPAEVDTAPIAKADLLAPGAQAQGQAAPVNGPASARRPSTASKERMPAGTAPPEAAAAEPAQSAPATGTAPAASADAVPAVRLVVVSANFAGREFVLEKPSVVIGRTDDNDIVLDHRSISRHHAKIVYERGRFSVVDLQSSNGVRVNGEEYGKVDLRRGDLVDLGHVRFRFVEPDEDFVFARDATVVDLAAAQGRGSGLKLVALFMFLGAVATAVYFVSRAQHDVHRPVAGADADAGPRLTAPRPDAVAVVVDAAPPPANDVQTSAEREARDAVQAEDWQRAAERADVILAADPQNEVATRVKAQAQREQANAKVYDSFEGAFQKGDLVAMAKHLAALSDESVYTARATPRYEEAKNQWIRKQVADAESLASEGKCSRIPPLARKAGKTLPEVKSALDGVYAQCQKAAAAVPVAPPPGPSEPTTPTPVKPPKPPVATPPAGDFDALLDEAKSAFAENKHAKALSKAEEALAIRGTDQQALSIAAVAACRQSKPDLAIKYYERLKGSRQQSVKVLCNQAGVTF